MEKMILNGLLENEKRQDEAFSEVWTDAEKRWKSKSIRVPKGFRDEYGIAVMAYTNKDNPTYSRFNSAVRDFNGNPSSFRYHSFHYFLTHALVLLRDGCWEKLYRGMSGIQFEPNKTQAFMRFGQFSSSSTDRSQAEKFGSDSFFTISSCFGVSLETFSNYPIEKEILIPVDETFEVISFTQKGTSNMFTLQTTKNRCQYHNCLYLKKMSGDTGSDDISTVIIMFLWLMFSVFAMERRQASWALVQIHQPNCYQERWTQIDRKKLSGPLPTPLFPPPLPPLYFLPNPLLLSLLLP
ncbi:ecto-ADP-ribosyltransferase 5-like [Pelodytes ibericus]